MPLTWFMRYFQFFTVVCRASRYFISPFPLTGCSSFPLSSLFKHSSFMQLWKVQYYFFTGLGITRHEPKAKIFLNIFSVSYVLELYHQMGKLYLNLQEGQTKKFQTVTYKGNSHTNVSIDKNRRKTTSKILHDAYVILQKVIKLFPRLF